MTRGGKVESWGENFVFNFYDADVKCAFTDDTYSEDEKNVIRSDIKSLSKEIHIDRTYVDFEGSKYEGVYITGEGWKMLCELVEGTNFGKSASQVQIVDLLESYRLLICGYIDHCLDILGYDMSKIEVYMDDSFKFATTCSRDDIQEWKHYPGDWRDWW